MMRRASLDFFDGISADNDLALIGLKQRDEHPHGGGFPRAVGTNQPENFSALNVESKIIHSDTFAKAFG